VWVALIKSSEEFDKKSAEFNARFEQSKAEADRRFEQSKVEADRRAAELDAQIEKTVIAVQKMSERVDNVSKNIGGVNNRIGDIVEHLIAPGIISRFKELGYAFDKMSRNTVVIAPNGERCEVDAELHNGKDIMLIEIKAKPTVEDIDDHVERITFLQNLGKYRDQNVYGAIAGAVFPENVKKRALKIGFYVIEQSGETMRIETLGGTFKGKKW
jgi:sugar-specific transcriptional regulator TrmB